MANNLVALKEHAKEDGKKKWWRSSTKLVTREQKFWSSNSRRSRAFDGKILPTEHREGMKETYLCKDQLGHVLRPFKSNRTFINKMDIVLNLSF
jgi:hypothetical protein